MTNVEAFRAIYLEELVKAVAASPTAYSYNASAAPTIGAKMVEQLARGNANLGPTAKLVAKKLGIKPTLKAIREYLAAA